MQIQKARLLRVLYDGFAKLEEWFVGGPHLHLVVRCSDSVAILLHDVVNHQFLLVKQSRAAMVRKDNPDGFITEAIAGRFDVSLGPVELAVKEAFEEAGAIIQESQVELLNQGEPMALSAGITTERSWLAYAAISPNQLTGNDTDVFGVEAEGEKIERVWVPETEIDTFVCEDIRVLTLIQYVKIKSLKASTEN
jgi:hypothetical protein